MNTSASRDGDFAADGDAALIDAIGVWVEKELRPVARKFDLADEYPTEIVEQMKALGLFGATIGEAYGGLGLSAWTYAQITMKVLPSGWRHAGSSIRT